jgi:hypothetical protein
MTDDTQPARGNQTAAKATLSLEVISDAICP